MKIRVKTRTDEAEKIAYYRDFEIVKSLPNVGDIDEVSPEYNGEKTTVIGIFEAVIDCEQGSDEIYNYEYFRIRKKFENLNDDGEWELSNEWDEFLAVEKKYDD